MRSLQRARIRHRRQFSTSAVASFAQRQRLPPAPKHSSARDGQNHAPEWELDLEDRIPAVRKGKTPEKHAKSNEVGVQLLSRSLHAQLFKNSQFPSPPPNYVNIARQHLKAHGLNPSQGSVLPDIAFTLPPLQGKTLDEHFYRLGSEAAQPWLDISTSLSQATIPPRPDHWDIQPGWTKYTHEPNGAAFHEHVEYPDEDALVFDVETLPHISPYAVIATAASPTAWYAWISPWLLGHTDDLVQLPSLGPSSKHRVVVGHNVSYDRLRLADEYHIRGTNTRFVDTMALHVAIRGISSHQRPAWTKHRKRKTEAKERTREALEGLLWTLDEQIASETVQERRAELEKQRDELLDGSVEAFAIAEEPEDDATGAGCASERWEDITAANSLADVARLHCDIEVEKEIRNDFLSATREEILAGIQDYLTYCASDVAITHNVYKVVFPTFRSACPSPVSFAGVLTMGSAFLPVNQEWERYIDRAESTYRELNEKIKSRLVDLAIQAKEMAEGEKWRGDPWLEQMDWTPKKAGASRGVITEAAVCEEGIPSSDEPASSSEPGPSSSSSTVSDASSPKWYQDIIADPFSTSSLRTLPFLLRMSCGSQPIRYTTAEKWHYLDGNGEVRRFNNAKTRCATIFGTNGARWIAKGELASEDDDLAIALCDTNARTDAIADRVRTIAKRALGRPDRLDDPWLSQLDWSESLPSTQRSKKAAKSKPPKAPSVFWPKWYWDLAKPKKGHAPGTLDLTVRNQLSPLLLRLSWRGWPLFRSREHGWTFRVPRDATSDIRQKPLTFDHDDDASFRAQSEGEDEMSDTGPYVFYKMPHKDGESANVGSPLGKTFMKFAQDGTLTSPGNEARDALDMNAQCSYWISARDRIMGQTVVWQNTARNLGFDTSGVKDDEKWGVILPQVITMGTVTRRAIEKTWLTASNAKANRVGSELKAMVRAPPGYALVGADVDAEELWISSLLGDAQFGMHGATAVGWMTLEGTKAAGTDLHSKTGSILGISRDQAKVFNYSRIYGAGQRHAVQLLLQGNANMDIEDAQKRAEELYAQTKGKNTHRTDIFGRKFWYGGSESFLFNKLEAIACSDRPQTPALGCGVTSALSAAHLTPGFGTDFMTSRINWAVQSSGVDYLHLLIVAMDHLSKVYDIDARYLLSVHDEVRYLVRESDKHRAALALQIANLWTRALFAQKLGFDDLPAGVAFFSAVDVDNVLRKEPAMTCVTPSQPHALPPGESLGIEDILARTNGGSLRSDGTLVDDSAGTTLSAPPEGYVAPDCLAHRAPNPYWLRAQATSDMNEIRNMAMHATGKRYPARRPRPSIDNDSVFDLDREYMRH